MRACVELTLQLYNSKIALPNSAVREFAHTDGDWLAEGFGEIPAPQCVAFTSPSHVGGKRLYDFRFYDLSTDEVRRAERTHACRATRAVPCHVATCRGRAMPCPVTGTLYMLFSIQCDCKGLSLSDS